MIRWVIDTAHAAGSTTVITVIGHDREQVIPHLADCVTAIQEELLGTGHAVMMARAELDNLLACDQAPTLLVLCGDTPLLTSATVAHFVASHQAQQAAASVLTFIAEDPFGYGRIIRDDTHHLAGIVEEKDATEAQRALSEVNSGMYCFDLRALLESLDALDAHNAQNEYYLTDTLALIRQAGGTVCAFTCADANEALGINDRTQLAAATRIAQARINREHMLNGTTMLDPCSVWIGPDVSLAQDVELLPLTFLMGTTAVGEGSRLGPNTRVTDSLIGRECVIEESVVNSVQLEDRVQVGPRAFLRPGTLMRTGSRAGTHVEIKNSEIGPNSKVPHLSYIGDATLGSDVNIGAGSITCNYDGTIKSKTRIGDRCMVGSDTMFVAPVTIGSDVVTGAGSVITKDVPDGALAIERNDQRNIEGYAERKRKKQSEH